MIFDRLAVGTGNWGKEYNGAKVSEDDQKIILDYCQCSGIDTIDTAVAYEWDWTKVSSYFKVVVKVNRDSDHEQVLQTQPYCVMAHIFDYYNKGSFLCDYSIPKGYRGLHGVSLYEPGDVYNVINCEVIQVPYSLYDRRFEKRIEAWKNKHVSHRNCKVHVRSVFLRGRILKEIEPWKCIAFCLMNPYIDKVIIGADSSEQFIRNLRPFQHFNNMEKTDLVGFLDPREW